MEWEGTPGIRFAMAGATGEPIFTLALRRDYAALRSGIGTAMLKLRGRRSPGVSMRARVARASAPAPHVQYYFCCARM